MLVRWLPHELSRLSNRSEPLHEYVQKRRQGFLWWGWGGGRNVVSPYPSLGLKNSDKSLQIRSLADVGTEKVDLTQQKQTCTSKPKYM